MDDPTTWTADQWVAFKAGMREAANICGTLAETTYDDSDGFAAATGCEAAIIGVLNGMIAHETGLIRKQSHREI